MQPVLVDGGELMPQATVEIMRRRDKGGIAARWGKTPVVKS